jgi:hypothetical protein
VPYTAKAERAFSFFIENDTQLPFAVLTRSTNTVRRTEHSLQQSSGVIGKEINTICALGNAADLRQRKSSTTGKTI